MIDINSLIKTLQNNRKIFHSEDDLKLSIATEILKTHTNCQVRLEKPIDIKMIDWNNNVLTVRSPIDIVIIEKNGDLIPIELKYKTKKTQLEDINEEYLLTDHNAVDIGRYSFRKDIYRIEQYLNLFPKANYGYVLILTNDKAYTETDVSIKDNFDKFFTFHNKAIINTKDNGWNYNKIDKTKYEIREGDSRWWSKNNKKVHWTCVKDLFYKLDLKNNYKINWNTYSQFTGTEFKYCLIEVNKKYKTIT